MIDAVGWPQSVLVMGGSSDIGRAAAQALVARRARRIVLAGRHAPSLSLVAASLRDLGAEKVDHVLFDAEDVGSHERVVDEAFGKLGDVDVVLVTFGVLGEDIDPEADPDAALSVFETNCVGAVSIVARVARRLRNQGHGVLVVMSSVAAERPRSNFVYGSSKAGLDAFCLGLGDKLVGSGVRVVVVRPGFVTTKMTHGLPRAPFSTTPDAVAERIVRAIESGQEEVWCPPLLRYVMFAVRHLPRTVFRRLERMASGHIAERKVHDGK